MFASTQLACLKIHTRTIIPRTLMSSIYHIIFIAGCRIYHRIITGIFFFVSLKILQTSLSLRPASAKQSASLAKSYCPVDNDKKLYSLCFSSFYLLLSFLPCSLYLRNFAKNTKRFLFLHNIKYTNYQEITIITGTFPLPTHELHLSFQARKESYSFSAREYPLQLLMY